jgi:alpha-mannosidase
MFKDVPSSFDAWDIDSTYESTPVELPEDAAVTVVAQGPLVAKVKVVRKISESTITQEISLRRNSRRIDFATKVDWKERHKLLKACFPVEIHSNCAVHEIQMGHIRRPNHRSRQFDADRFEVCNQKWTALCEENRGCAVLNDCKYGVNVLGKSINLTLLKSSLSPDMTADRGLNEFTYSFFAWNGSFADCDVVRQGYDLNIPVVAAPGAGGTVSLFSLDAPDVIIETVKPAEDRSGDVVVRLYESKRMAAKCALITTLPAVKAVQTDMLENRMGDLALRDGEINLSFKPFEIKTIRLKMK